VLHLFLPNKHVKDVFVITPEFLQSIHKKGIIVDLDNTLIPWNEKHATEKIKEWLSKLEEANIQVIIFSNNNEERVSLFANPIKRPYVSRAKKPLKKAFKKAQEMMGLKKDEIVVIGDQLLTDILGGNRIGFYTILVVPIVQSDALITKFNRKTERFILNHFYRKGKLKRREDFE